MKRFSIKEKKERKSTDLIFSVILFLYSSQARYMEICGSSYSLKHKV